MAHSQMLSSLTGFTKEKSVWEYFSPPLASDEVAQDAVISMQAVLDYTNTILLEIGNH